MAKSVPQRMAIISAGVIMNVIFAFLMAIVAYCTGRRGDRLRHLGRAAGRGRLAGRPAARAIAFVAINNSGDRQLRFRDLRTAVALCDMQNGIDFRVKREGRTGAVLGQRQARPREPVRMRADDRRRSAADARNLPIQSWPYRRHSGRQRRQVQARRQDRGHRRQVDRAATPTSTGSWPVIPASR